MSQGNNKERITQNNAKIEELIELVKTKGSGGGSEEIVFDRIFSLNTPSQISAVSAEISKNGYTSAQVAEIYGWKLGDSIPITLTSGEKIEAIIIGFNHDIMVGGSEKKAGITLQMKNCLATLYPMSTTASNAGGYPATKMVNETLPTIEALIPKEWRDVIKVVKKKCANGGSSNYTETVTIGAGIFLLSEIEVRESVTIAQNGESEGSTYEYWKGKVDTDRIKKYDNDGDGIPNAAYPWWLRSCYNGGIQFFCVINGSGVTYQQPALEGSTRGISFAFCV